MDMTTRVAKIKSLCNLSRRKIQGILKNMRRINPIQNVSDCALTTLFALRTGYIARRQRCLYDK